MTTSTPYAVRELTAEACRVLLARNDVGRLAFTLHDRVDIEPINYVTDGAWIFGRTSRGTKLTRLLHNPWCAFEIDALKEGADMCSVVVKGAFYLLDPDTGPPDTWKRADTLLRRLVEGAFTESDPMPHRNIVFGIFIQELSGRSISAC